MSSSTNKSATLIRFRWPRFRFSLRTFLIVCVLPVPPLAWLATVKIRAVRQRAAITSLETRGVAFVKRQHPTPNWVTKLVRRFVDNEAFDTIQSVTARGTWQSKGTNIESQDIEALIHLNELRDLDLIRLRISGARDPGSHIELPDSEVSKLADIRTLTSLSMDVELEQNTQSKLASLPELHSLILPSTRLTDDVLQILGQQPKLSALEFDASDITENGLRRLSMAPVLQTLCFRGLRNGEQTLADIVNCRALTHLTIFSSRLRLVDADFINKLPIQTLSLHGCEIERGFFLQLQYSKGLKRLAVSGNKHGTWIIYCTLVELGRCEDHYTTSGASSTQSVSPRIP